MIHPAISLAEHPWSASHDGPCLYLGPLAPGRTDHAGLALDAAHAAGRPVTLAGTDPPPDPATAAALGRRLARGDTLRPQVSLVERWALLETACCLLAPLAADEPYSLAVVEALAYGIPVVGLHDTVAAELVDHQLSGLLVLEARDLWAGVRDAPTLDPKTVRRHAARFDVAVMVAGYERLFARLVAGRR